MTEISRAKRDGVVMRGYWMAIAGIALILPPLLVCGYILS
jgi:hypothetical protein